MGRKRYAVKALRLGKRGIGIGLITCGCLLNPNPIADSQAAPIFFASSPAPSCELNAEIEHEPHPFAGIPKQRILDNRPVRALSLKYQRIGTPSSERFGMVRKSGARATPTKLNPLQSVQLENRRLLFSIDTSVSGRIHAGVPSRTAHPDILRTWPSGTVLCLILVSMAFLGTVASSSSGGSGNSPGTQSGMSEKERVRHQIKELVKDIGSDKHPIHISILSGFYLKLKKLGIEHFGDPQVQDEIKKLREQARESLMQRGDRRVAQIADQLLRSVEFILRGNERIGASSVSNVPTAGRLGNRKDDRMGRIKEARDAYRYIGVSIQTGGLAISLNDGYNNILSCSSMIRWEDDERFCDDRITNRSCAGELMDLIVTMISILVKEFGGLQISLVTVAAAGPVNKKQGIVGSEFQAPRLPFYKYPLRDRLSERLRSVNIHCDVEVENDTEASRNGERNSPKGRLRGKVGGVVFIGREGVNISVDDVTIQEAGHNLIGRPDGEGNMHYSWVGHLSRGFHPIQKGKASDEIAATSGERGEEYVSLGEEEFERKYPDFPMIDSELGEEDVEDRLTADAIRTRITEVAQEVMASESPELPHYRAIDVAAQRMGGAYEQALSDEAQGDNPNPVAVQWIEGLGFEVGMALAAFISFYKKRTFVKHLVLVADVNEHLGKGVFRPDAGQEERDDGLDRYIENVRLGALADLVNHFGFDSQEAETIVKGIVRSHMSHERALIFHRVTDEDVLNACEERSQLAGDKNRIAEVSREKTASSTELEANGLHEITPDLKVSNRKLEIVPKEKLLFGTASNPVTTAGGVIIGCGVVLPEVNLGPPVKPVTPETIDQIRQHYRDTLRSVLQRAVLLSQEALVLHFEQTPEFTAHPDWSARVISDIREILEEYRSEHGLRSALRVTLADIRGRHPQSKLRTGELLPALRETFERCAIAGADILSIESTGGYELYAHALRRGNLDALVFALGVLAPRDMQFLWDNIVAIARNNGVRAGAETGLSFVNAALQLAEQNLVSEALASAVQLMCVPRSLVAIAMGATGPLNSGYGNSLIKAITGIPISIDGAASSGFSSFRLRNRACAVCDLVSNGSIQDPQPFAASVLPTSAEQLISDCRLLNTAIRKGAAGMLRDTLVESDRTSAPQAVLTELDATYDAAHCIAHAGEDPLARTIAIARYSITSLQSASDERRVRISAGGRRWLDGWKGVAQHLPDNPNKLYAQLEPEYRALFLPEEYGIE